MRTKPENCADSVCTIWKSSTSLERGDIFIKISPMILDAYKKYGIPLAVFFLPYFPICYAEKRTSLDNITQANRK